MPGLTGVVAVAGGAFHSLAVKSDGSVWAWGGGGLLGDGFSMDRSTPVQVQGLTGAVTVAAGSNHSLALKADGSVWAWGYNWYGQLGDGTTTWRSSPVQVPGLTGVVALAAGDVHSLAVKSDGSVWVWGDNNYGQLGDGTTTWRSSPVQVPGLTGVVAVAAGNFHTLTVKSDGSVWAWGYNWYGQLGDGTTTERHSPVQIRGITGVVALAAGRDHSLALKSDGSMLAWGGNDLGQLGDGTLAQRLSPVLVVNPSIDGYLNLNTTGTTLNVPSELQVPFFVSSTGGITTTSATVSTTTKFNAADVGQPGAVFVTAMVPSGSLGVTQQAANNVTQAMSANNAPRSKALAAQAANSSVMMQLTPSGWQQVSNGQLIPYASGVLGDQLAAQTILNGTDTTNLKGAEFCLGYGTSAAEMNAVGRMRAIVTIPDPNATNASTQSCVLISDVRVFAYAEANYPSIFTGTATAGQATYQGNQYDYRYYPASGNYLAVDDSRVISLLGPYTGGVVTAVGPVESFKSYITTWELAH